MLKSCRQLTMLVRTAGALVGRASCSWMDRYGRPASPPPLKPPRSASKDRSIRRVIIKLKIQILTTNMCSFNRFNASAHVLDEITSHRWHRLADNS